MVWLSEKMVENWTILFLRNCDVWWFLIFGDFAQKLTSFLLKKYWFIMESKGKLEKKWFKIWVKFRTFQTTEIVVFLHNICSNFELSFFEFPLILYYIFIFWRKIQPNFSEKFRTFETKNWEPSHVRIS